MTNLQKNTLENQISEIKSEAVKLRARFIYNVFNERLATESFKRFMMRELQNRIIAGRSNDDHITISQFNKWYRELHIDLINDYNLLRKYKEL